MADDPDLLRHQREQQLSVWIPFPLSQLLDELCAGLGRTSAGTVRRKELVAALIFDTERDHRELANLVSRYREAPAWEGSFRHERPGPRATDL
jgi:hypothetical protein